MKPRKRAEGAAVDGMKHGDTSSAARVDHDPMRQTSVCEEGSIEPPAFPIYRDDALVDEGTEVPKPCISSGEMRTSTPAGSLLLTGTASTTTGAIFLLPPFSWSLDGKTKKLNTTTVIQTYATYSSFRLRNVVETKLRQTLVFDPGGYLGRLRGCPFLGGRRALLRGMFV